jgi:hypothetical protein
MEQMLGQRDVDRRIVLGHVATRDAEVIESAHGEREPEDASQNGPAVTSKPGTRTARPRHERHHLT